MIGFSKIVIQYPNRDHHVKEVTIDLTHSNQSNNEILVTPKLVMKDINGNNESNQSTITVVVIATIGYGNANIYLLNNVKPDLEYVTPLPTASFVKSAIISSTVQYPKIDHHLCKYLLKTESSFEYNTFSVKGESFLNDRHNNKGNGQILASAIICNSIDQRVFAADFSSETIGESGIINIGDLPQGFQSDDFQLAVFLNGFQVSFGDDNDDHHVFKIEASAEICEKKNIQNEICVKLNLKSFLTDNGKHGELNKTNIPHNVVSGFVIAFSNKVVQ